MLWPFKMNKEKQTILTFVLDRSGSMSSVKSKVLSGFNEYVEEMKSSEEPTVIRLNAFDSDANDVIYDFEDINDVRKLSEADYILGSLTPLYDAIGQGISATRKFVEPAPDKSQVIFTIMTDGLENASVEYDRSDIFNLISKMEAEGWNFVYLGANQDSWGVGESMGIQHQNIANYDASNPDAALRTLSQSTKRTRSSMRENRNFDSIFTTEELKKLNEKKNQLKKSE